MENTQKVKTERVAIYALVAVFILFCGYILYQSHVPVASQPSPPTAVITVGSQGYLHLANNANIPVLRSKTAFDQYVKDAAVSHDTYDMANLISQDYGFLVPSGTKVLVIDAAFGALQVRVQSGDHTNESGWVPTEFVSSISN